MSTTSNFQGLDRNPGTTATPQAQALDKNFRNAISGLKRELVRSIYYLRAIFERKVYRTLGYDSIWEYGSQAGDLTKEQCFAFLKIGAKLKDLPEMEKALGAGILSWRKASILVGKVDAQNESLLLDQAKDFTCEELKTRLKTPQEKRMPQLLPLPAENKKPARQGKGPCLPPQSRHLPKRSERPEIRPRDDYQYITYKLTPEQYSLWSRFTTRWKLSKEDTLVQALGAWTGPRGPQEGPSSGCSGFLIIIRECPVCGRSHHHNNRGAFEIPAGLLKTAHCDATIEDKQTRHRSIVSPKLRRRIFNRDNHTCQAPSCSNTQNLQIHHRLPLSQGGLTKKDNLVTLCWACHRALHEEEENLKSVNQGPGV